MSTTTFPMVVTVVRQPGTEHEDGISVVLESLNLPGDVPTTMTWHYDADTAEIGDSRGEVYLVTLKRVPEADFPV